MITVVITSNGRPEKLKKTIDTFMEFNTYPIHEYIIIEDSGDLDKQVEIDKIIDKLDAEVTYVMHSHNLGQIQSIDEGYELVKTQYLFHLEDDWLFYRSGFMEKSLKILENNKEIMQVWFREAGDTNTHPVEPEVYHSEGVDYRLMGLYALGGSWHGFSWNPGLRRLADYKLVAPFSQYIQPGDFNALTECRIGQVYFENWGFRAAILTEGYVKHII